MELFSVNKDLVLEINEKDLISIKCFRDLVRSRLNITRVKGDSDGRDKKFTKNVLIYIYLMYDYKSTLASLPEDERHKQSLKDADLEEEDVLVDYVADCIHYYKNMQIQTNRGLRLIQDSLGGIDKVRNYINTTTPNDDNVKDYMAVIQSIDKVYEKIRELEEKAKSFMDNARTTRGGEKVRNREIPK